jgi:hypothetical protein
MPLRAPAVPRVLPRGRRSREAGTSYQRPDHSGPLGPVDPNPAALQRGPGPSAPPDAAEAQALVEGRLDGGGRPAHHGSCDSSRR